MWKFSPLNVLHYTVMAQLLCMMWFRILVNQPEQYSRVGWDPWTIIHWSYDDWTGEEIMWSTSWHHITSSQAVAGIFSSIASIISVSVGPISTGKCVIMWVMMISLWCHWWSCDPGQCEPGNVEYSALGYFMSAVVVIIICLVSFLVMIRMVINN